MLNQKLRYSSILKLIKKYPEASICEVGSGSYGIGRFLKKRTFTGVDSNFKDYTGVKRKTGSNMIPVEGSAIALPFKDNEFDIVLSLDMIEHIAYDLRTKAFTEIIRVSKKFAIVGFPCDQEAYKIDKKHKEILEKYSRNIPGWLEEHCSIEYPTQQEINNILNNLGYKYYSFNNESITLHKIINIIEYFTFGLPYVYNLVPKKLLNFLGQKGNKFYRRIYVIEK